MRKMNSKWLVKDIYSSIILSLYYEKDNKNLLCGTFEVDEILNATGDESSIEFANIDDITKFITMGIVRFRNVFEHSDILDIPFRNLYMLYEKVNSLTDIKVNSGVSVLDMESFLVMDDKICKDDYYVYSYSIDKVSEDLNSFIKVAKNYGKYDMQMKFDSLAFINMINYKRNNVALRN